MKLRRLLPVLAIFAVALLLPGPSPAAKSDGALSMIAARDATRSIAWEVARRNHLVSSVKVGGCRRLASDQIFCQAIDRGSNSTFKTTCTVRVRVTLVGTRPNGALRGVHCDNERLAILRVPQALEAAQPIAKGLRDGEWRLSAERRISRTEILVEAVRIPSTGSNEACSAQLTTELTAVGSIAVRVVKSFCVVIDS